MKRLVTLSIILSSTFYAFAQDVEKTVTLDEVTVKAAKVVNKADGMIIYPTDAQKQSSNNGYSILEKLTLANLRIDNISHSITAIDNRGGVQIRTKVSHLPFYRLFQMIVSCNLQINNSLTFCKRKLMLYINSLLQHLMVTKQVGLLQAHQQSVYLPSNSPWYQPH